MQDGVLETDVRYMRRCLQLALCGQHGVRPNPMVGAVIVAEDRIIGEGYHVKYGTAHAEVNAFASVRPENGHLLDKATIYVSLEPCAHYGKTPPCASLIVSKGVKRVVIGCVDPFSKVSGRGIEIIRQAGIAVTVGVLEKECRQINRRFFTFHEQHRPYIVLKWAQSTDGFIDSHFRPVALSTPFTRTLVHELRSTTDAILVGRITAERDKPRLDVRFWSGPKPVAFVLGGGIDIPQIIEACREQQLQSLLVEGGAATLNSFIRQGLWDELRIETAPVMLGGGTRSPEIPAYAQMTDRVMADSNTIDYYVNNHKQDNP